MDAKYVGKLNDPPQLTSEEWDVVNLFATTKTTYQGKSNAVVPKNWLPFPSYFYDNNFLKAMGVIPKVNKSKYHTSDFLIQHFH